MNTWYHSQSAARKWGGRPEDYQAVNTFIDSSKQFVGDARHRALLHSTWGCFLAEQMFGPVIVVGGKDVPTRLVAERHIIEDLGWLPSPEDYLKHITEMPLWFSGSIRTQVNMSEVIDGN